MRRRGLAEQESRCNTHCNMYQTYVRTYIYVHSYVQERSGRTCHAATHTATHTKRTYAYIDTYTPMRRRGVAEQVTNEWLEYP